MPVTIVHWMGVGDLSEIARMRIKNVLNGFVRKIENEQMTTYLVGIPCELIDLQQYPPGVPEIRVWLTSGKDVIVEIPSKKLKFSWSSKRNVLPMYASIDETILDIYQEEDLSPMDQAFREAAHQRVRED